MCSFGCWRPTYERFFLAFSRRHNKLEINQWARQNSRPLIPHERQQKFHPQLERFKNLDPPIVQGSVDQLFGCNWLAYAHIFQVVGGPIVVQSPFENSNVYPPVIKHKTAEDFPDFPSHDDTGRSTHGLPHPVIQEEAAGCEARSAALASPFDDDDLLLTVENKWCSNQGNRYGR